MKRPQRLIAKPCIRITETLEPRKEAALPVQRRLSSFARAVPTRAPQHTAHASTHKKKTTVVTRETYGSVVSARFCA